MFGGSEGRRAFLCIAAVLAVGGAVGCGSDDDASGEPQQRKYAAASETPEDFVRRLAKLLETTTAQKDCAQLMEINGRSFTRFPCPPPKGLRRSMASFKVVGAEIYGTGAVVDYKSGEVEDGAAIVMFTAPDRNWGVGRFGVVTEPSTRTSDEDSREGFEEAIDRYLSAVRERDCAAYAEVTFNADKTRQEVCKTVFPGTEALAKRLRSDPSATPKYEGGNASYGFFSLETSRPEPENLTISILKTGSGDSERYVILDAAPSPTAEQQRLVIEAFEEQRKRRATETEPTKKPSDPAVKP